MADIDLTRSILTAQPLPTDWPISAVRYIRRLNGGTQAHLMQASDGGLYAVKFQNNPFNARALASEFLATRLGLWLGLPMPQVELIEVPDRLVNRELLRIEIDDRQRLVRCASGRQLALRYFSHALEDISHHSLQEVANRLDFIRVLPFDKWIANCDNRQAVFIRRSKRRSYRAIFIDQHNCFNAGRWTFPDFPHHAAYDHEVYSDVTGWFWFEPILSRIAKISRFDLWKIATEIPPEWYQHDTEALSRLIERLYKRRMSVRELIDKFRTSGRNPFPRWKGN